VRHPLYTAGLAFIWFTPLMTVNLLVLNIGLTVYIVIGAYFEERKLLREFGPAYAEYQRRTPMLVPGLRGSQ
jgi:protein-S-isoprenylcysteine O-methyltransferase Ste14